MAQKIEKILSSYTSWLKTKGYKKRGIEEAVMRVKQTHLYCLNNDLSLTSMTVREAEMYIEYLRLVPYDAGTINVAIAYLTRFFKYLIDQSITGMNPFADIERIRVSKKLPRHIYRIEEMGVLLDSITVHSKDDFKLKTLLEILYSTGARITEIETLRKDDVHLDEGFIVVRDDKERQDRKIPLTEIASECLKLYMTYMPTKSDLVFCHGKSRTLNRWINDRLKKNAPHLKLPPITCHSFRHALASHLILNGADLREVQSYLGHRRLHSTELYTHMFPEDLREMIETVHPREGDNEEFVRNKDME